MCRKYVELAPDERVMSVCGNAKRIYATGCSLIPIKLKYDSQVYYSWIIDSFEDKSYADEENIKPISTSATLESLYGAQKNE